MTVIARAPLRLGLAGGGTDLPAYADRYGGLVLNVTIDRYVYVILTDAPPGTLQITAADANSVLARREHLFDSALFWGADYALPMAILEHFGVSAGCRVFIASEVPPGTGLGSSSATAVALIAALACRLGRQLATEEIAELASHIEIERMRMPIGYQDQYAAAFGGLNCLEISRDRRCLRPCAATPDVRRALEQRLLLFFTGKRRRSTDILQAQRDASRRAGSSTVEALHEIKHIAEQMIAALECGDLDHVGRLLHDSWVQKRRLAPGVTTPEIDAWYAEARDAGALGGKITGAGGGGFLMLYADPARRSAVIQRMSELGLVWVDADFDVAGVTTLLREPAGLAVA